MMDNMLFLSWSEHSEATIERSSLNLASMFERVTDYFEVLAAERNLRFEAEDAGTVWADTARQGSAQSSRLGLSIVRPS